MGKVFNFQHARVSAGMRAAKIVSVSAVTSAVVALSLAKMADHHSAGTLSRCHHFETVEAPAPISAAIASREGQSSIRSRNERVSIMKPVLGQSVLKGKDILALDLNYSLGHTVRMADSDIEAQFKQEFVGRVKAARMATGMKQWQVADAIGVPQDHYKHWEKTRLMPHHLIGRFCIICRVEPDWLLTGKGQKPLKPPHLVDAAAERESAKPKRAKRSRAA